MPVDREKMEAEVLYAELRREPKTPEEIEAELLAPPVPLGAFTAQIKGDLIAEANAESAARDAKTAELWRG